MMTAAGCSRSPGEAQPNIVLIVSDDAGYADFGAYGGQQIPTPNIDSIARDGVRFSQGYVTASVCAPSRAGLLTGRYQQRFGNECNNPGASGNGMPPEETTIAEALRALGYRTMIVGKWHQGWKKQFNPLNHGFDSFFGFRGGGRGYFPEKPTAPKEHNLYRDFAVQPESSVTYTTEMFTDLSRLQRGPCSDAGPARGLRPLRSHHRREAAHLCWNDSGAGPGRRPCARGVTGARMGTKHAHLFHQ